ncbi:hypothetical protein PanWU01x14_094920 [Parasponia andersonii]|uniref:Uncharacterized protein n=1 Tax=Parasponia andersonii TaxID=3476 RepID=A0A2P5D5E0_PARAD|nr:hypothetical protein PanWU01x14_094920 [Parasponia andersonii]
MQNRFGFQRARPTGGDVQEPTGRIHQCLNVKRPIFPQNLPAIDAEFPNSQNSAAIRQRKPPEIPQNPPQIGLELEEMPQFLVDRLADGEERPAGSGGGAEPEAARHGLVGGAVGQAVERGGEDVVGRDRRGRGGVEIGGEEPEEEGERGLGHAEGVRPDVIGPGGEEAAEPAFRWRRRRRRRGREREEGGGDEGF